MASVFPSSSYVPSTPSTSSQSSLPPSYAISIHDHILPPGWQCKYDPKVSKYYFLPDHLAHQWEYSKHGTSSNHSCSSRVSSPSHPTFTSYGRYFQPFSSRYKVAVSDSSFQKISQQFPHVDESYINHLMKIYHYRENLVISALLSEGYTRSLYTPPDEALFYKLKGYFPTVEPDNIRQLLSKHHNAEHEVIGAIISQLGPTHARYQSSSYKGHPASPKMKLRYLKLVYPDADEAALFDLLYNCDHNAQEAMSRMEAMGYKKTEINRPMSAKPSEVSLSSLIEKGKASRPTTTSLSKTYFPPSIMEKDKLIRELEALFPKVNKVLINMALESSGFSLEKAKIFLSAMTPQDSEKYLPKEYKKVETSPLMSRLCRGTQTNSYMVGISATPIKTAKTKAEKSTVGTSTTEDGIILPEKKKPVAKGPDPNMRKGPTIISLIKSYLPWKGSDPKNRHGPDSNNKKGADSSLLKSNNKKNQPKGPQTNNRKGAFGSIFKKYGKIESKREANGWMD